MNALDWVTDPAYGFVTVKLYVPLVGAVPVIVRELPVLVVGTNDPPELPLLDFLSVTWTGVGPEQINPVPAIVKVNPLFFGSFAGFTVVGDVMVGVDIGLTINWKVCGVDPAVFVAVKVIE